MDDAECDQRKSAAQRAEDGICRKGNIMADREEEDDRAGSQWQANDPAADSRSPTPPGQTSRTDNNWSKN